MDVLDNLGMSGRTFKLVYYGNLIFWGMLVAFLILFIILELVKDGSNSPMPSSPAVSDSLQLVVPDMKDILLWGYHGRGVKVNVTGLFPGHLDEYEDGFLKYSLNKYLSDRISMRRPLPDVRNQECRQVNYDLRDLPSVSVVVVFRNEPRTTLLRMLYSVIDRSPPEVVAEIILVDDGTEVEDLQYPQLENYLSGLIQVSIVRLPTQLGPAQARMHGAKQATGDVIVFLQPRCECTHGWLSPLLHAVAADTSTIAVPLVDTIDHDTFQYMPVALPNMTVGSFTWDLATRKRALTKPLENATLNMLSPVIADGIFALARGNLHALGGFDGDLILEDSVNIEFSFRSWLCGSQIVQVPCSHVGYIIPGPPLQQAGVFNTERIRDSLRVADRWMGTYRYFVYERMPPLKEELLPKTARALPKGNASCQSFDWFLHKLEPAMSFAQEIQRRGQIVLAGTHGGFLSLGVADDNILLQSGVNGPATIWYHLESGALVTENKTCLSLVQRANTTEQFLETMPDPLYVNTNVLEPPGFVHRQHVENQIPEVPAGRQKQDQFTSQPLRGILFQGQRKLNPHAVKTKQSVYQNKSRYPDKKSNVRYNGQSRVDVRESPQEAVNMFHEKRIRSRSLLNSDSGASRSLSMASVSQNYLHNRSEADSLTFKLESEESLVDTLVVKPCVSEADGDHWSYTWDHTLRHQTSGLCLEAHRDTSGHHLLRLARCAGGSQAQQWSFVSSLLTF